MKTSVIRYRVADFLRESAPFDAMSIEDVLAFAGSGRVLFHEGDIDLFSKGEPRQEVIWVVQQGRIEMLDERPSELELRDVLGPGDILGLRSHDADRTYRRTARTATEVILYAFDSNGFETLVGAYPEALRFLAAHVSASTDHTRSLQPGTAKRQSLIEADHAHWLNMRPVPKVNNLAGDDQSIICSASLPVREVARRMNDFCRDLMVVTTSERHPIGLITQAKLCEQIADGIALFDTPAVASVDDNFQTVSPQKTTGDYLLAMLQTRNPFLVVTRDGSRSSPVDGVLVDTDLEIACGRNPVTLCRALGASRTLNELAFVWRRAEAFVKENLRGPEDIDWFQSALSELRQALVERLIDISVTELTRAGKSLPSTPHVWISWGEAGRGELVDINCDLVLAWATTEYETDEKRAESDTKYFSVLLQKVTSKLETCGLAKRISESLRPADSYSRPISEWKEFFTRRMQDPIGTQIYSSRECFDFALISGETQLALELQQTVHSQLHNSDAFIAVLANDTLAKLPPLTFFQGIALEANGHASHVLDLDKTVLAPITDGARVLTFLRGGASAANTIERLAFLRSAFPQHDSIIADAADAWRIACYQHLKLRLSGEAAERCIRAAQLTRLEQRMLKTAFDSTRSFIRLACLLSNVSPQE